MRIKLFTAALLSLIGITSVTLAQTKNKAAAKATPRYSLAASITSGLAVYKQYCLTCHQADGGGVQNLNPPLAKTTFVLGDKTKLINIVLKGFNEDVEINGNYYSNAMPAHNFLTDQQVADVLSYVRNNFGNKASGITVAEVKKVRETK
jgi:mono/diheme cytochrome c family protein